MTLSRTMLAKTAVPLGAAALNIATALLIILVSGREVAGFAITIFSIIYLVSTIGSGSVSIQIPNLFLGRRPVEGKRTTQLAAILWIGCLFVLLSSVMATLLVPLVFDLQLPFWLVALAACLTFLRILIRQVLVVLNKKVLGSVIEDYVQPTYLLGITLAFIFGYDISAALCLAIICLVNLWSVLMTPRLLNNIVRKQVLRHDFLLALNRIPVLFFQGLATFTIGRLDVLVVGPLFGLGAVADFTLINRVLNGMIIWRGISFNQFVQKNGKRATQMSVILNQKSVFLANMVGQIALLASALFVWLAILHQFTAIDPFLGVVIFFGFSIASLFGPLVGISNLNGKFKTATVINLFGLMATLAIAYIGKFGDLGYWILTWMLVSLTVQITMFSNLIFNFFDID